MLRKIFDLDNPLMRGLAKITDIVVLNLLFLLCCLPVITAGASAAALYAMTLKMVRNEEPPIVRGFFRAFRENLKQGIFFGLVFTLVVGAILINLFLLGDRTEGMAQAVKAVCIAMGILVTALSLYVFPIIARFQMDVKEIFRNAVLISVTQLPRTGIMLLMYVLAAILAFWSDITMFVALSIFVVFGFALLAFLQSFLLRSIFSKYEGQKPKVTDELM